jgi:hypothetical protein
VIWAIARTETQLVKVSKPEASFSKQAWTRPILISASFRPYGANDQWASQFTSLRQPASDAIAERKIAKNSGKICRTRISYRLALAGSALKSACVLALCFLPGD